LSNVLESGANEFDSRQVVSVVMVQSDKSLIFTAECLAGLEVHKLDVLIGSHTSERCISLYFVMRASRGSAGDR